MLLRANRVGKRRMQVTESWTNCLNKGHALERIGARIHSRSKNMQLLWLLQLERTIAARASYPLKLKIESRLTNFAPSLFGASRGTAAVAQREFLKRLPG